MTTDLLAQELLVALLPHVLVLLRLLLLDQLLVLAQHRRQLLLHLLNPA